MPATKLRIIASLLTLTALPAAAIAEIRLPGHGAPVPTARPALSGSPQVDRLATGSVAAAVPHAAAAAPSGSVTALKNGLDALSSRNVARARQARDRLPAGSLDRQILSWAIALSGDRSVPSSEIAAAARELSGWPGMAALRRNIERALHAERAAPQTVVQAIGGTAPLTFEGTVILARSHVALGNAQAARAVLSPFWRTRRLEAAEENAILREFGNVISQADHRWRMEQMLHNDRVNAALRVSRHAGAEALAKAWGAVLRRERNAGQLLDAVPAAQRGTGYIFARARHLRWSDRFKQAAEVMLTAPRAANQFVDPDAWWVERRVLSRELLDLGEVRTAYRIAAEHAAQSPSNIADAEFHAGWYALRGMRDARTAAPHFARIAQIAEGPISLARAHFWLGRAAESGGPGNARAHFERAAQYGTAFYGQLAAAKLGRDKIAAAYPSPTPQDRQNFARRHAVQAIQRLEAAGHPGRANILYRDLAGELTSAGELAMLAVMAERRGDHHLALIVGKIAASRGLDIGALSHPVGAIPASANISGAGMALAYAIARQESEFNVSARSGAGALGLLQLLPGTAQQMARRTGLAYSQSRLTTDPGYNATLGAAYLNEQLGRFDGSYVLTFAGYNAGPRRAQEWMSRYGDPRGKDLDTIVDWIERIPFTETRGYVQRVMENYQVYKMRLSGRMNIVADLVNGR